MNRPIDLALSNLIPRYSGQLPHELVELASGLLAQSRMKASNLRAEEEVGRLYACANIACERLKTTLNLPPIEPRPPVPPRVYNKLYSYLDKALVKSSTPRKRDNGGPLHSTIGNNAVHKVLPQRQTPSKEKTLEAWRSGNRAEKARLNYNKAERELPMWIVYAIRLLCRQMQTRKAIPHVIAGVETLLYLSPPPEKEVPGKGKKKEEKKVEVKLPAIIAAVWFFVSCRMLGKDLDGDGYVARRNVVLDVLQEMSEDEVLKEKIAADEEGKKAWVQINEGDVRTWMNQLAVKGWIDMDWFLNIPQQDELDAALEFVEPDEVQWYSTRSREELRKAGLGSMLIGKYDFLSEENRKNYKQWKKVMLLQVDEMLRDGTLDNLEDE